MQPQQPQDSQPDTWRAPVQAAPQAPFQVPQEVSDFQDAPDLDVPVVESVEPVPSDDVSEDDGVLESPSVDEGAVVRWQSSEYLHQDQSPVWFVVMGIIVAILMAAGYFWMRSISFVILVPVMAVALVVYVKRPPALNDYTLSRKGLHVNDRLYPYDTFRSFGIVSHDGIHSVVLVPRKRFQLGHTLYFSEELGEQIVDMLAARLPMNDVSLDIIDKLLSKLRL